MVRSGKAAKGKGKEKEGASVNTRSDRSSPNQAATPPCTALQVTDGEPVSFCNVEDLGALKTSMRLSELQKKKPGPAALTYKRRDDIRSGGVTTLTATEQCQIWTPHCKVTDERWSLPDATDPAEFRIL